MRFKDCYIVIHSSDLLPPVCCYSLVSATNGKLFLLTAPATVVHVPGADHVTVKTLLPLRRRRFPSVTNATICVVAKEQSVESSSSSGQDVPVVIGSWCRRDMVVAGLQSFARLNPPMASAISVQSSAGLVSPSAASTPWLSCHCHRVSDASAVRVRAGP